MICKKKLEQVMPYSWQYLTPVMIIARVIISSPIFLSWHSAV